LTPTTTRAPASDRSWAAAAPNTNRGRSFDPARRRPHPVPARWWSSLLRGVATPTRHTRPGCRGSRDHRPLRGRNMGYFAVFGVGVGRDHRPYEGSQQYPVHPCAGQLTRWSSPLRGVATASGGRTRRSAPGDHRPYGGSQLNRSWCQCRWSAWSSPYEGSQHGAVELVYDSGYDSVLVYTFPPGVTPQREEWGTPQPAPTDIL